MNAGPKHNEEIVLEDWWKSISNPSIKFPYFVNKNETTKIGGERERERQKKRE